MSWEFLLTSLVIVASPGTGVLITLTAGLTKGRRAAIVAALGGVDNLQSQQPLALTRVRVVLRDVSGIDQQALSAAGVAGVMPLADGVVHLITGLRP